MCKKNRPARLCSPSPVRAPLGLISGRCWLKSTSNPARTRPSTEMIGRITFNTVKQTKIHVSLAKMRTRFRPIKVSRSPFAVRKI
eukprot:6479874-Amphidinium_carterae.1